VSFVTAKPHDGGAYEILWFFSSVSAGVVARANFRIIKGIFLRKSKVAQSPIIAGKLLVQKAVKNSNKFQRISKKYLKPAVHADL